MLAFNIMLLMITKKASALLSFMAIKAILPFSVILFCFKWWPLLHPSEITVWDWSGLIIIIISLFLFRYMTVQKTEHELECMSLELPFLDRMFKKINKL